MKNNLITITKGSVYLIGIAVITVCAILLPELAREEAVGKVNPPSSYPFLIGAWILSLPIFIALHQTLKLINYVKQNKAFSNKSVKALKYIKYSTLVFSFLIVSAVIAVIVLTRGANPPEDITPVITIGFIFTFVSSLITTFVAILERLLKDAINIKSKNDLII